MYEIQFIRAQEHVLRGRMKNKQQVSVSNIYTHVNAQMEIFVIGQKNLRS